MIATILIFMFYIIFLWLSICIKLDRMYRKILFDEGYRMIGRYAEFIYHTEGLELTGYKITQIMNKVYMDTKKYMIIPVLNFNIYNQAKMILGNSNTRNNFVCGYLKYKIKLPEKQKDYDL